MIESRVLKVEEDEKGHPKKGPNGYPSLRRVPRLRSFTVQMNEPPGARLRVALSGLAITEYFRDEKNQDVLLFIDNILPFLAGGI